MQRKEEKKSFFDRVLDDTPPPEVAEIIEKIKRDRAAGASRYMPWSHRECRDWRDAWLYSFRRGHLNASRHMRLENNSVTHVVWIREDFSDKLIGSLEKIAERLGPDRNLIELRLIRTRVTSQGIERLKAILPNASIRACTKEEEQQNPNIKWVSDS